MSGIALAQEDDVQELVALVDRAAPKFGRGVRFFQNIDLHLITLDFWEAIGKLAMWIPRDELESAVAAYHQGCEKTAVGDHETALEIFEVFKRVVVPSHGP